MKIEFETGRTCITLDKLNTGDTFRLEGDAKSPTIYIKTDDINRDNDETLCVDLEDGCTSYFPHDTDVVKLESVLKVKR